MAVIKVEFDKPYDEFELAGKVYHVYFDDDSLTKYETEFRKLEAELSKKKSVENMNQKQYKAYKKEQMDKIGKFLECFFGEGTFDEIYEASGRSVVNLMAVVEAITEWMEKKMKKFKVAQQEYYTKKA